MSATGLFLIGVGLSIFASILFASVYNSSEDNRRRSESSSDALQSVEQLQLQLRMALDSIRDLDLDYDMGKISNAVYSEQRKMLLGRAVSLLRRLDQAETHADRVSMGIEAMVNAYRSGDDLDLAIESAVSAYRR